MDTNQIVIILFALLYFGFIIYTRRKGDFAEFSVAGRSLGVFLIFASISASFIGPAMTMGLSRNGFTNGLFLMFIASLTGVSMMISAFIFAPRIREKFTESYSIGDVIGGKKSHNHFSVKILVGIISAFGMVAITTAMAYAGGELINNIFGFSKMISIVVITVIVVIYSSFGGIRATIQTDAFQLINFALIIPLLAIAMVIGDQFSWTTYSEHIYNTTSTTFDETSFSAILGLLVFWILGGFGLEASWISRFLASKNSTITKRATFYAGAFIFSWVILIVFIGSVGGYLHPELPVTDQLLLNIAEIHFNEIMYGVFIIAMIGVVLSSMDSTLNNAAIIFSEDIVGGIFPNISGASKLKVSKIFTVATGIIAIIIAGYLDSILDVIMSILSYYFPVMAPVIIFSVFKEKHYWQSAIAAMVMGLVSYVLWDNFGSELLPATLIGIGFSSVVYFLTDFYFEKYRMNYAK